MTAGTFILPAPLLHPAGPPGVTAYFHPPSWSAWLDVTGEITSPVSPRRLLSQLRRAHSGLPPGVTVVGLDLTRLDEITVDLAVLLCLESRMLGVRDIELAVVLRDEARTPPGMQPMLQRLRIWRVGPDQLDRVSQGAAHARLGRDGWQPLREPGSGAALAHG